LVPVVPLIAIGCCMVLMLSLPLQTWVRFFIWLAIGIMIYLGYSRKRSKLAS
ncbi:MAG: amino acid transporter, partial [bacterium]|nr:amino acid transporter [bacterium]